MSIEWSSLLNNKTFCALLILALSLLAYSNSFNTAFQFDDYHHVVANQHLRSLGNIPHFFVSTGMSSYEPANVGGYRPLAYASFAVNYALSGERVWGYHAVNFALHLICAFLVYLVVASVLERAGGRDMRLTAFATAAIFALHPVQTGAVTYVTGRAVLLASMFTLLGFFSFLRYRSAGPGSVSGGRAWGAAALVFFLLGLLSKEFAVVLPALMALYDVVVERTRPWRKWLYYAPFIAALLAFLAVRNAVQGFVVQPHNGNVYSLGVYLMSEARALLLYVRLLLLPVNQNVDYSLLPTTSPDAAVALAVVSVAAVLYLLYRLGRSNPAAAFFGYWFFAALAPESTLVPITDIAVEYRLYLPSVGFIACIAAVLPGAVKAVTWRKWAVVAVLVMFTALAFTRNAVWATEYTLWSDAARKAPHSPRAHANLGHAMRVEHKWNEAVVELKKALEPGPHGFPEEKVRDELGICYYELGKVEESLGQFSRAIAVNPGYVEAYGNLGTALFDLGRYREAVDVLERATVANPEYALGHIKLSLAYLKLGRNADALREAEAGILYSPKDYVVRYGLAMAYMANGRDEDALSQARVAAGLADTPLREEKARMLAASLEERLKGARDNGEGARP